MSRIKLLLITLLVLLLGACSQPTAPKPGLGSPPPIACDVQALYSEVQAANDAAVPDGAAVQITLQEGCSYALAGRALGFVQDSNIEIIGNGASINAQGKSRGIINRGSLQLNDLTVTGGHATSEGDDGVGGGIWNSGALELVNTTVSGNSADFLGGGVFNAGTLTGADYDGLNGDDNIHDNTPNQVHALVAVGCSVVQELYDAVQAANDTAGSNGNSTQISLQKGCTYNLTGRALEFGEGSNIEIVGNGATITAKGNSRVIVNRGTLHLSDLEIRDGYATGEGDAANGGAIWNSGHLQMTRSTVSASTADKGGEAVCTTAVPSTFWKARASAETRLITAVVCTTTVSS